MAAAPIKTVDTINAPEMNPHIPVIKNVPITMSLFKSAICILSKLNFC